jgi:hypothetical protein
MDVLPKDLVPLVIIGINVFNDFPKFIELFDINLGISELFVFCHFELEKVFQVLELNCSESKLVNFLSKLV